jgi:phosphomannomutase/phosphoglucomutase
MLTGSHNPPEYNGLKIVVRGVALSQIEIKAIYNRIVAEDWRDGVGVKTEQDIQTRYIHEVCQNVRVSRPLRVVLDAGNGVAGAIAPRLFRALGCEVFELFCDVDGTFPNHHPDPSQPENVLDLIRVVREKNADVGLAFDGDGDRIGVVTNEGEMISSDRLLMLFAKTVLAEHPKSKIIFDVKCTNNLAALIQSLGGEPIMWKTGHSLIKAKLLETQAQLAGEVSGHIFFNDRWYGFDDALYAGARLLEILANSSEDAGRLFAMIPDSHITPELKVSVSEEEKFSLMQALIDQANFSDAKDINTMDGLRVDFSQGWGLVRASNTTPCLILRFEAINEVVLSHIKTLFRDWMLSVKPDLALPF